RAMAPPMLPMPMMLIEVMLFPSKDCYVNNMLNLLVAATIPVDFRHVPTSPPTRPRGVRCLALARGAARAAPHGARLAAPTGLRPHPLRILRAVVPALLPRPDAPDVGARRRHERHAPPPLARRDPTRAPRARRARAPPPGSSRDQRAAHRHRAARARARHPGAHRARAARGHRRAQSRATGPVDRDRARHHALARPAGPL